MLTLADRLQMGLERRAGATQADLAAFCGVKPPSVSAWFTGETKSLKAASLRKAAEFLGCSRDWLETGLGPPGWMEPQGAVDAAPGSAAPSHGTPLVKGVAHEQSLTPFTVPLLRTVGEIMNGNAGNEFRFEVVDDAMSPYLEKGVHVIFSTTRHPKIGLPVLIKDESSRLHVRFFGQGDSQDHWRGMPHASKERIYKTFDSRSDGAKIVAVFCGTYLPE